MRVFLIAPLLCLAACSPRSPAPPAPQTAASSSEAASVRAQRHVLAGVDLDQPLQISGTEPFWSITVNETGVVWSSPEGPDQTFPKTAIVAADTTAVMTSGMLSIALKGAKCSDGMSDRIYPLTANVTLNGQTYNGCAAPAKKPA